jgi:ATP synthase protein I
MGLVVTGVLAVPAVSIALAAGGGKAAAGVGIGLGMVALFFTISKVVLALVARHAREFLLPAALGTYIMKVVILGILLFTIGDTNVIDALALAWAVFTGVFGWVGAELWVATHTRVPFYDPEEFRRRNPSSRDTQNGRRRGDDVLPAPGAPAGSAAPIRQAHIPESGRG